MYETLTFKEQVEGFGTTMENENEKSQKEEKNHKRGKKSQESKASPNPRGNSSRMMAWLICQTQLRSRMRLKKQNLKETSSLDFIRRLLISWQGQFH